MLFTYLLAAIISPLPTTIIENKCPKLTPKTPAKSILDVRIDEIKVIGAMGDSVSAAFVARPKLVKDLPVTLVDLIEYRGISFSTGGDVGSPSLGNLIGQLNPNLVGKSKGQRAYLGLPNSGDGFNVAVTGAIASDLHEQTNIIISKIKGQKDINLGNDFKLITLFIGSNDICNSCINKVDPDAWANLLRTTITKLEQNIPRTIVIIPQLFRVSELWDLTSALPYCDKRRASPFTAECRCAFMEDENGKAKRKALDELTDKLNDKIIEIRNEYVMKNSSSFMVTTDYSTRNFSLKKNGLEFISDTDCFHPSQLGHEQVAKALFSNLSKPFDQKNLIINKQTAVECPSHDSRIQF